VTPLDPPVRSTQFQAGVKFLDSRQIPALVKKLKIDLKCTQRRVKEHIMYGVSCVNVGVRSIGAIANVSNHCNVLTTSTSPAAATIVEEREHLTMQGRLRVCGVSA